MSIVYEKCIHEAKDYNLMLTVSEFRGNTYLNIRKYFLSYEGEYIPSKEGISMEFGIENTLALLEGLLELVAEAGAKQVIVDLYNKYGNESRELP